MIQEDGTPKLDFSKSGCTFCEECANVCEPGVNVDNLHASEQLNATFRISTEGYMAHTV